MQCGPAGWGVFGSRSWEVCGLARTASDHAAPWKSYAEHHRRLRARLDAGEAVRTLVYECSDAHCGGWGFADVTNGLASTLYFAMMSERAFFVRWDRNDLDMLDLLDANDIDVRLPPTLLATLSRSSECHRLVAPFGRVESVIGGDLDPQCVVVQSNFHPASQFWRSAEVGGRKVTQIRADIDAFSRAQLAEVQPEYATGCAFNFLFRPSERLLAALGADAADAADAADPHLAMHARLPDTWRSGRAADAMEAAMKQHVQRMLECGNATAWRLRPAGGLRLFFASSSDAAREASRAAASRLGLPLSMSDAPPVHALRSGAFEGPAGARERDRPLRPLRLRSVGLLTSRGGGGAAPPLPRVGVGRVRGGGAARCLSGGRARGARQSPRHHRAARRAARLAGRAVLLLAPRLRHMLRAHLHRVGPPAHAARGARARAALRARGAVGGAGGGAPAR
mmetsp:Transcript_28864/g.92482  ORF Transcript_28864/g.92482 Transcript_28864/m.92482 type:complete len:453 (+) Transcript_28864:33-1391(+)